MNVSGLSSSLSSSVDFAAAKGKAAGSNEPGDKREFEELLNVKPAASQNSELRETFHQFVGETFFGTMMKEMRKSVGKTPYFNGGRAEEVFQQQLDQLIVEDMTKSSSKNISEAMFHLMTLPRG